MFENIIGNTNIKTVLEKSIKQNKLSHSYLFVGIQGIGKKMIATEFAKMILCLDDNKYCNHCKSCIEFDTNNNPDFVLISPDGNNIKIEQIRSKSLFSSSESPSMPLIKVFRTLLIVTMFFPAFSSISFPKNP